MEHYLEHCLADSMEHQKAVSLDSPKELPWELPKADRLALPLVGNLACLKVVSMEDLLVDQKVAPKADLLEHCLVVSWVVQKDVHLEHDLACW